MEPGDGAEPGYDHKYRRHARDYIIEVCNKMEDIAKPETYTQCEKNGAALFSSAPNREWAPLPDLMSAFAAAFLNDDKAGADGQEGKGKGGKGKGGKGKGGKGAKQSQG